VAADQGPAGVDSPTQGVVEVPTVSRCEICKQNLDGQPVAFAEASKLGIDERRYAGGEVCLPCGVAIGGTLDGIRLTSTGLAEAIAGLTVAARAVADTDHP